MDEQTSNERMSEPAEPPPKFDPAGGHQQVLNQLALEIGDITVQLRDIGNQIEALMFKQSEMERQRRNLSDQASAIARANRAVRGA